MPDLPRPPDRRKLVLASSSPRRRQLLREGGYDFTIEAPRVPEHALPDETPEALAVRLAREKCEEVAARVDADACVLAADTLVVLDGTVFGKPADEEEACGMLRHLAGRTHRVLTGFCVQAGEEGTPTCGLAESVVRMREVSEAEAAAYAASGEPLDKAGGYAVQGEGGRFVAAIEGLRSNVIGLPLEEIAPLLAQLGVRPR